MLLLHSFAVVKKTDRNSCQQALWNISHNDSNEEDDCIQPEVTKNKSNDKEWDSKKHSNTSNEMDKVSNFTSYGSLACLQTWC